ncbi:homoserine kinase [Salimicrobium jeotgali]|uniref:Homoserine kinase n=1 Tax=Salimicrobium jeotgali TaxID=1230341 RepID=K2GFE0_9BACI|nr:homoserine kinase [Salimicrobium jeotgali]AKG03874.1 homoserine kinase [Salimicrobium jeotgali]EKE32902.1 homoserine kinase [Salimicrobium jeotgali]MBM7695104.1 homoserine kinase [Salimicrobium jeotgali]
MNNFTITVPATSANLGPGFDSVGIALTKYASFHCEPSDAWHFIVPEADRPFIPAGTDNLVYQAASFTAREYGQKELIPCVVTSSNEVPVSRGLGSSSTAVVAGIELANQLLGLDLSEQEKVVVACKIEGHPDNVAPAICGGIVIAHYDYDVPKYVKLTNGVQSLQWLTIVPDFHLKTEEARDLLPKHFSYKEAVYASSTGNVLVAALAQHDWKLAGEMMEKDRFHQVYRSPLLPDFAPVSKALKTAGSAGTYVSGAGPTMIGLFEELEEKEVEELRSVFPHLHFESLRTDTEGVRVEVHAHQEVSEA